MEVELAPDEQVLCQFRYERGDIIRRVLIVGFINFILLSILWILQRGQVGFGAVPALLILLTGIHGTMLPRREAIVTNHRLLYDGGRFWRGTREVRLDDIEHLGLAPGIAGFGEYLSVEVHDGKPMAIEIAPAVPDLWGVLVTLRRQLPEPPPGIARMRRACMMLNALALFWGLLLLAGFLAMFLNVLRTSYGSSIADVTNGAVMLLLGSVGLMISGMGFGLMIGLMLLRAVATFDEAQTMLRMTYRSARAHSWRRVARVFYWGIKWRFHNAYGRMLDFE